MQGLLGSRLFGLTSGILRSRERSERFGKLRRVSVKAHVKLPLSNFSKAVGANEVSEEVGGGSLKITPQIYR